MPLIRAAGAVLDGQVCRPGWLDVSGDRIVACGSGPPPGPVDADFPVLVPGFVDMHVHGGGGASFTDDIQQAAAFHHGRGSTTVLASLVTAAPDVLLGWVEALAEATRRGLVAGIHLEGPWLSRRYCGAHDPQQLRSPDRAEVDALLTAGAGAIRMVTLAPELPGGIDAITRFVNAGVVVAVGHTDARYDQVRAAIDAGARVGTHLFNAMRGLHHREPGPVLALLEDSRVTVELIADNVHIHPALLRHVIASAGPDRVALVTDAVAAAGSGGVHRGPVRLGGLDVDVLSGVARIAGTSTLAGSTATMDQVFRAVASQFGPDADGALAAMAQMTSTTPARALGLDAVGCLRPGLNADLVVLDQDLRAVRVMRNGAWLDSLADDGRLPP